MRNRTSHLFRLWKSSGNHAVHKETNLHFALCLQKLNALTILNHFHIWFLCPSKTILLHLSNTFNRALWKIKGARLKEKQVSTHLETMSFTLPSSVCTMSIIPYVLPLYLNRKNKYIVHKFIESQLCNVKKMWQKQPAKFAHTAKIYSGLQGTEEQRWAILRHISNFITIMINFRLYTTYCQNNPDTY